MVRDVAKLTRELRSIFDRDNTRPGTSVCTQNSRSAADQARRDLHTSDRAHFVDSSGRRYLIQRER